MIHLWRRTLMALLLVAAAPGLAAPGPDLPEIGAIAVLVELRENGLEAARGHARALAEAYPDFSTARVLEADLDVLQSGLDPTVLDTSVLGDFTTGDMRSELRLRWLHHLDPDSRAGLPLELLQLPSEQPFALVADLESARMYLFANRQGRPELLADFYVGMGRGGARKETEGDLRTPVGVYRIVDYIPGGELPDLYGAGAFPVNYPNGWDRANGRTGHGIWIHGVPSGEYSRPPLSSEGCVTVTNDQFDALRAYVEPGRTPLITASRMHWVAPATWQETRDELVRAIEQWRTSWESGDADWYSLYAHDFRNSRHEDRSSWIRSRQQFDAANGGVTVELSDIALYRYDSAGAPVFHAEFRQHYRGPNLDSIVRKEQLWRRSVDGWEIVYEELDEIEEAAGAVGR